MIRFLVVFFAVLGLSGCEFVKNTFSPPETASQSYVAVETGLTSVYTGLSTYAGLPNCPTEDGAPCRDPEVLKDIIAVGEAANASMDAWREALRCPESMAECTPDPDVISLVSMAAVNQVCAIRTILERHDVGNVVTKAALVFCEDS